MADFSSSGAVQLRAHEFFLFLKEVISFYLSTSFTKKYIFFLMWMFACMYVCESHARLAPMEPPAHALLFKLAEWTAPSILCFVLRDPCQRVRCTTWQLVS